MAFPQLSQTVSILFDWNQIQPGDGGILGESGVVIGIDPKRRICAVEMSGRRLVNEYPADDLFPVDTQPRGVVSRDGRHADGVYRTRQGRLLTFSFRKAEHDRTHFELRKQLAEEHPRYTRIDVEVPQDFELTKESILATLRWILK